MPDFTPRPTVYKGIQMRSRLEAGFAQWLDTKTQFKWQYEPRAFATEHGQYLPDFLIESLAFDGSWQPAYVEVKPPPFFAEDEGDEGYTEESFDRQELLWRQMAGIWQSVVPCVLLIVGPGRVQHVWDDPSARCPWAVNAAWLTTSQGVIGVGVPAGESQRPWHGDWWKVQPR